MDLSRVIINNFRSIESIELEFESNFKILVGKNESGKSNILKALSLLSPTIDSSAEDIREPLPNEKPIESASIYFEFTLTDKEIDDVYSFVSKELFSKNKDEKILLYKDRPHSLKEFCQNRNSGLWDVNLLTLSKSTNYWSISNEWKIIDVFKKNKLYKKPVVGDTPTILNSLIVNTSELKDYNKDEYISLTPSDINRLVGLKVSEFVRANLPNVIYWNYDESNLLPAKINIDEFATDPETCIPLKNLFKIAGISNIQKELTDAINGSANKLRNLLERVANHATEHFKSVWKEYNYISFFLHPNGDFIDAGIKEKNSFSLNQRSDGFKRFVTFLIMLSVNAKNKDLSNSLILIDEPDLGLHPTGIRSLRDELINISNDNKIVASSHSIFMIDKENFSRHYIVKKEDEITTIEISNDDNIVDEEVLYRVLVYIIYDDLKKYNLLFEGWKDKTLFKTALKKIPNDKKAIDEVFKAVGTCHALGVKSIKNISSILELHNKNFLVISDNDTPAIEKQNEFRREKCFGTWKRYNEILKINTVITSEDFIKDDIIKSRIDKIKNSMPQLNGYPVFESNKGVLYEIDVWLKANSINNKEERKSTIDEIKNSIFNTLKPIEIKNEYWLFLEALAKVIEKQ